MNHKKLDALIMVAKTLNHHHILWRLGASCMLYLRGYVDHFNDIDIMISLEDVKKVKSIFNAYPYQDKLPNELYKTKVFLEYQILGVDIDMMAGFAIQNQNKIYEFPLTEHEPCDELVLDDTVIYLSKVDTWLTYYQLMNREDKVNMIKLHGINHS